MFWDKKDLCSYYCYEKNILAPADGVVVSQKYKVSEVA